MCRKEETINRLFLHCEVATTIWSHFIDRFGLVRCGPMTMAEATKYWLGGHIVGLGVFFDKCYNFLFIGLFGE